MYRSPYEACTQWPTITRPFSRNTVRSLADVVSQCSGIPVPDILGPRHTACFSKGRQILTWLARRYTSSSSTVIARHTGRRNHTTVLHAIARVDLAIREASIAAPASDTPEAWAAALWAATWPPLDYRNPMKARS